MTLNVYLSIGLILGILRALVELASYLYDWYRARDIVHFGASLEEFAHLTFFCALLVLLLLVFWPLWVWHRFSRYRREGHL